MVNSTTLIPITLGITSSSRLARYRPKGLPLASGRDQASLYQSLRFQRSLSHPESGALSLAPTAETRGR